MECRASRARRLAAATILVLTMGAVPESSAPDAVEALREARQAREEGDALRALRALRELDRGPLADHANLLIARWQREGGALEAALTAARAGLERDPPSEVRALLWQELARAQLARDNLASAYRAQREAWESTRSSEFSAELAAEFARVFEAGGLPGDALRLYREIWHTWPRASASDEAFRRSRFLEEATGSTPAQPKSLVAYASSLRSAYRCGEALEVYERVLALPKLDDGTRRRSERGRADCLFQRRRYEEAQQAYRELARSDPGDVDAAIRAARSHARAGQTRRAVEELTAIAQSGKPAERARAQYLVAVIVREEDPASSQRLFRRVERQKDSKGLARLARWRLAWDDLRSGKHANAVRLLGPLTRGPRFDIEVQRALYWTGVARLELGESGGREPLLELTEKVPLSYYGMLAADRLGVTPRIEHSFLGEPDSDPPNPHEPRARWLMEGGFPESSRAELESWIREGRLTRAERIRAASLLHSLGDHFRAVRLIVDGFGSAFEQGIDPGWREAWHHAWPQPFGLSVRAAVQEFDFEPALVYAVMREESTYRPEVQSPAGAVGLMQIVPPTGNRIASTLGENPFAPEHLLEPNTNIRFGTYYLKYLLARFRGSLPQAVAAYNAGPDTVADWVAREGPLREDAFVDSVPYSETRRYVRRVMRSYRLYRMLYEPESSSSVARSPGAQPAADPLR